MDVDQDGHGALYPSQCVFCCRPWSTDPDIHCEDRKRKMESLRETSFSGTLYKYILGGGDGGSQREALQRLQKATMEIARNGCQLTLCTTCLGLLYELKELHVTLDRIQNLIVDKVKEIKNQIGGINSEDSWVDSQQSGYSFQLESDTETPTFNLQNILAKDETQQGGGLKLDVDKCLKMDNDAREDLLRSVPSSSRSDCDSSIADGSMDGMNFDGTRRGRRRKPVQLVDNAKKSKQELISHMKGVNKDLFICDIEGCYAFFNTVQGLSQHKRQHFRDSWPICGECNYTTPWPSAMNRHFATQHPGMPKNIKRANRRNPSCAFTVNSFIQQNEQSKSPSSTIPKQRPGPHSNETSTSNLLLPSSPSTRPESSCSSEQSVTFPTSLAQWKVTSQTPPMLNDHQRRFYSNPFSFEGPR